MEKEMPADWAINGAITAMMPDDYDLDQNDLDLVKSPSDVLAIQRLSQSILAHARLIEKTQPAPVDRKLLCAREARARGRYCSESSQRYWRSGEWDDQLESHLQAITLYESGFGKD